MNNLELQKCKAFVSGNARGTWLRQGGGGTKFCFLILFLFKQFKNWFAVSEDTEDTL